MRGRTPALALAVLTPLALASGCGAFRASAGPCLGLGGSVRAGPADVGLLGGVSLEWGNAYGAVGSMVTAELGLGIARGELLADGSARRATASKAPLRARLEGLIPDIADPFLDPEPASFLVNRPAELAVSLYAVFFSFHLGVDFASLWREVRDAFVSAAGADAPEPPDGSLAVPAGPEDSLTEPPYAIATSEDVADLASGSAVERTLARRKLAGLLADPRALFQERLDLVERDVPVASGLFAADLPASALQELLAPQEGDAAAAFERGVRANDPVALGAALAAHPLAAGASHAARVRLELLVERGDLDEALAQLEDLTARAPELDDDDVRAARALEPSVRALVASLPRPPVPGDAPREAWSGSADLGGVRIGAAGRAVWAATPGGDVAWERSDALALGFCARKVVGEASGLAIVEAVAKGRPWVLALDADGETRWSLPLPAPAPGCGAADQVYALGSGRVFVGRTDRVVALEAATGRLLWMHVRHDPEPLARKLWKEAVPFDFRPPEGPDRRRPDGPRGFRVRLTPEVLELTSGTGRRVERLDPRSGALLEGD